LAARLPQKAMKAAGGEFAMTTCSPRSARSSRSSWSCLPWNVFESVADLDRYLTGIQKKVLGKDEA